MAETRMKTYFCIWHYIANYGTMNVEARNEHDAVSKVLDTFSDDFRQRATIYAMAIKPLTSKPNDR